MEKPQYKVEQYTDKWPGALKSAQVISEKIGVDPDRLIEFAEAGYCPHYRIDGGEPLFMLDEIKKWCARNILHREEGKELPLDIKVYVKKEICDINDPPSSIRFNESLIKIECFHYPPGVYFLCQDDEVIYVGQSINILSRIAEHKKDKKFNKIFMLPIPSTFLDAVEGALIRILKPKCNARRQNGEMTAPKSSGDNDGNILNTIGFKVKANTKL